EQRPRGDSGPQEGAEWIAGVGACDQLPARARREAAAVRLDAEDARPPVGEVVRLGDEGPDVGARREQVPRRPNDRHPSPRPSLTRRTSRSIRWRSAGETAIATTIAASPASAKPM